MERKVGTISRGIRCPIIREGDNLVKIVTDSVLEGQRCDCGHGVSGCPFPGQLRINR